VHGQVTTREGQPLAGARIRIKDHPELGQTFSRGDGAYDLAVNGGGDLTLDVERSGYLRAQRHLATTWNDVAHVADVALVPLDAQASVISLGSGTAMQVARGSAQQDTDGTRRATLLFPTNTTAQLVQANGAAQPVTQLTVRATEYTVGANGPHAMPGELPPTSAYTYAVELSADEAIAAGNADVRFSQPIPLYVENFLNFPVGSAVPVGYYDRAQARWIASDNGRVIKVLSVAGGLAQLDINGDGAADDAVALSGLGITDAERQQLALLYTPGTSLWRTPIAHFTPWDCNWPYAPPGDVTAPNLPDPSGGEGPGSNSSNGPGNSDSNSEDGPDTTDSRTDPDDCDTGSIIHCRDQSLEEQIGVSGTDLNLVYSSSRAPGRGKTYTLDIPVSGAQVPASMHSINLSVYVAGKLTTQRLTPSPNQHVQYEWDGKDWLGRRVQTAAKVQIRIEYEYPMLYVAQRADRERLFANWDAMAGSTGPLINPRSVVGTYARVWQDWSGTLRHPDPKPVASIETLGGWTLDQHHEYDPVSGVLHLGNGGTRHVDAEDVVESVLQDDPTHGVSLSQPWGVVVAADSTTYVSDPDAHRVWRVAADGARTVLAQLNRPTGLAMAPDGSLYVADSADNLVRRIAPDGTLTTVAGTGAAGFNGDGGLATLAALNGPESVAVATDGTLYIADLKNNRIRRVDGVGVIDTVVGGGNQDPDDGKNAGSVLLNEPHAVVVGVDDTPYFINTEGVENTGGRVIHVLVDGSLRAVAGGGGDWANGIPATSAGLDLPRALAVAPDGSLFVGETYQIRHISHGRITTAVGQGAGHGLVGQAAVRADLGSNVFGISYGPDGKLYFSNDNREAQVARVGPSLPGFLPGSIGIPSADASQVYIFNSNGVHQQTLDALTGAVRRQFGYDGLGRLSTLDDGDGNVTRVEYTGDVPSALVAPFGQRTALGVDSNNWLSSITDPANQVTRLETNSDGFMTKLTDVGAGVHTFGYDGWGGIARDENPDGSVKTLVRTPRADGQGFSVAVTTAEGRKTVYTQQSFADGSVRRNVVHADGTTSSTLVDVNGIVNQTDPDGTTVTTVQLPDPRWGMLAPLSATSIHWPDNSTFSRDTTRTVSLSNPRDLMSLVQLTDVMTDNGRATTSTYVAATRTLATISPEGRKTTVTFDTRGRVASTQAAASMATTAYSYEARGRLESIIQPSGTTRLGYGANGLLATVTDPLQHISQFAYDILGRVTTQTLPDGKVISRGYTPGGGLEHLTPPARPAHTFGFTPGGLGRWYQAPAPSADGTPSRTETGRDRDGQVTSLTRADGSVLTSTLDSSGRATSVSTPRGQIVSTFDATSGLLKGLSSPDGVSLNFSYEGALQTGEHWSGAISGSVSQVRDGDLRVVSQSTAGTAVGYTYDRDGLPTGVGDLHLTPDAANGLLASTSLGGVNTTLNYDAQGKLANSRATFGSTVMYSAQVTRRDALNRILELRETVGGFSSLYTYSYDAVGRLADVHKDGSLVEIDSYDDNGNRVTVTTPSNVTIATYDDQDRVLGQGNTSFSFTPDGEVATRTRDGQTTAFGHDPRGGVQNVSLPDGRHIDYLLDGKGRRVGKKVNGALVQGWLFQDDLHIAAELDGSGSVVSRFVYAESDTPSYMTKGGRTYRIVSDPRGSVRLVVDTSTGEVAQRLDYDTWGNVLQDTNPGFQPFGFDGGLYDRDSGLVRFGARDYDASAGRWTSRDPILFDGRQANLYTFVNDDPVNFVDPTGLAVSVCRTGDVITLNLDIEFSGPGANTTTINKFMEAIERTWTGQFGRYDVQTVVTARQRNAVETTNLVEIPLGGGEAWVRQDTSTGMWPAERDGHTAAHEAGHLMGLPDRYTDKNHDKILQESEQDSGWEGTIMAGVGDQVTEADVFRILENNKQNTNTPSCGCGN
jgi:RHS repeat-associated protein